MAGTVSIRLQTVSKRFGETRALTDCTFEACKGEVHAIVGENGSGKSTLAKIISGVLVPDGGLCEVLGSVITTPRQARDRGVATIFQEVLIAEEASVLDNLYVGSEGLVGTGKSRAERLREAGAIMTRCVGHAVDLNDRAGDLPLSVRQWIVIVRAILREPEVLIFDESSAALDLEATKRLFTEIARLRDAGKTILLVTHRIAELVSIADRATILRDGKAVGVLAREEITEARLLEMMTQAGRVLSAAPIMRLDENRAAKAPILTCRGLRTSDDAQPFDFSLQPGEVVGLAGLDGQGQERFARILAGIVKSSSGKVSCRKADGRTEAIDGLEAAWRNHISWVSGDRKREGIFPLLSILDNFALGIYRRELGPFGKINARRARSLFDEEARRLSIRMGSSGNRITSLSGGNQQKVLIARAFADTPSVIVFNDPARGVDIGTKRDLYRELQRFAESGGAVVYLSSEIEEFMGLAHRVDVFVKGTLFRSLTGADIEEREILGAMFGQPRGAHVELEAMREDAQ
ncbi:MAG TPA: sugar ABC transporter ATP-binding protein [Shinella sp.]|jgi:ribose transport system ATP-binding protein|uniref:sugar ABC transporter ATP-binding protein n=1 Tax=Shinella sp. TaxID=1870904 RepID=UPI002E138D69|nr:sugar ABC transporter ATP-binding protein [Shinella sp.]